MTVNKVPAGVHIQWDPTIDTDIRIAGILAAKGANTFSGIVVFLAGDQQGKGPLTLRLAPSGQTLSLEFKTIWRDPLDFRPAAGINKSCASVAEKVITSSSQFRELVGKSTGVRLMHESVADDADTYDIRVFAMSPEGETLTIGRFRIDFARKMLLQYEPIKGEYTVLGGTVGSFDAEDCE